MFMKNIKQKASKLPFFYTALVSIAAVIRNCIFQLSTGIPAIKAIGVF